VTRGLLAGFAAWAIGAGAAVAQQAAPPSTALPLELVGVMIAAADPARSTCLLRCATPPDPRRTVIVSAGDTACAVAEVREITKDAVVLRDLATGRIERLPLSQAAAPAPVDRPDDTEPTQEPRVTAAAPGRVTVELPKAAIDRYLANLPDLLSSALALPHASGSGIDGFQLSQVRDGGVAARVGLKNGDLITAINGEALDSVATALRLFSQAPTMTQATLSVMRDGQPLTVVIHTK